MWFIVWHLRPEGWPIYVILSIAFGLSMGLVTAWRVHKAKKKLGPLGWGNGVRQTTSQHHNKAFKADSQRLEVSLRLSICVYGVRF